MKLYKYLKKAKWKDDLYVEVHIKNNDVDDNCFSYAYEGTVDEIPLYCLTKQVIEIDGKVLNSEGNKVPCVVITVLSD